MHKKQHILIVDQNQKLAELIAGVVESEGYSVAIKTTGAGAIQCFSLRMPDLVLMDMGLSDRSALDVLTAIRAKDKELNTYVPVVGLTDVLTHRDIKITALRYGIDDFLSMWFDDAELLARVNSQLRVRDLHNRNKYLESQDRSSEAA